uniref:Uncharacterized protein n=1 Tax=Meloidogyne enterolobii TaxID=390850 RepID=A0A6V7UL74_MELEN|nr:unnamed protein product [Meloidogyne enterolobii]
MHHYNNSSLKRVQSEGKLLFVLDKNNNNTQNINKLKNYPNGTENNLNEEQTKMNKKWPTPPAMGISGRKLDSREYGRLVKMKKASRSQPQLCEIFDNDGDSNTGKWRNNMNINRTSSTREEFGRNTNKNHQKTKKAPPPPQHQNQQSFTPKIQPHSPQPILSKDKDRNDKESEIYAIVNLNGSKNQKYRQQISSEPRYHQNILYREPSTKSPQMLIDEHNNQLKYHQNNFNSRQNQILSPTQKSRRNTINNNGHNGFTAMPASNYSDDLLPQVVGC